MPHSTLRSVHLQSHANRPAETFGHRLAVVICALLTLSVNFGDCLPSPPPPPPATANYAHSFAHAITFHPAICKLNQIEPLTLKAHLAPTVLLATAVEKFKFFSNKRLYSYSVLFQIKRIYKYEQHLYADINQTRWHDTGKLSNASAHEHFHFISPQQQRQHSVNLRSFILIENFLNIVDRGSYAPGADNCKSIDIKLNKSYYLFIDSQPKELSLDKRNFFVHPIRLNVSSSSSSGQAPPLSPPPSTTTTTTTSTAKVPAVSNKNSLSSSAMSSLASLVPTSKASRYSSLSKYHFLSHDNYGNINVNNQNKLASNNNNNNNNSSSSNSKSKANANPAPVPLAAPFKRNARIVVFVRIPIFKLTSRPILHTEPMIDSSTNVNAQLESILCRQCHKAERVKAKTLLVNSQQHEDAHIECEYSGFPRPVVYWKRGQDEAIPVDRITPKYTVLVNTT